MSPTSIYSRPWAAFFRPSCIAHVDFGHILECRLARQGRPFESRMGCLTMARPASNPTVALTDICYRRCQCALCHCSE
eukprot:10336723-Alexandrium_andersonii.AAC.1